MSKLIDDANDHTHDEAKQHRGTGNQDSTAADAHGHNEHEHAEHAHGTGLFSWLRNLYGDHSHTVADKIDDAMESNERGIWALKISLIGLSITALFQVVVVYFSGSVALLADTIHNFADAATSIPLWIAFALARREPPFHLRLRQDGRHRRCSDCAGHFCLCLYCRLLVSHQDY